MDPNTFGPVTLRLLWKQYFQDYTVYCTIGYDLVSKLMEEFKMTALGTIQGTRKGLPKEFTTTDGRPEGDYMVLFDEASRISIHSEIWKSKSG